MGKISNTSKYPTVTPASADYMVATDVSDENNTKTVTVGSMATPMLGALSSDTPAIDDKLIGLDTSDSDNAKKFVVSDVLKTPVSATAAIDDKLIGLDTNDSDTPKRLTVSDVLKSPVSATAAIDDKLIGLDTNDSDTPKRLTVSDVLKTPSAVTAATDDFLLSLDTSDSGNPKKVLVSDLTALSLAQGYDSTFAASTNVNQVLAPGLTSGNAQVLFGSVQTTTNVDLAADGTITIKTGGDYFINLFFQVGNVSSTASTIHVLQEYGGVSSTTSHSFTKILPASTVLDPVKLSFFLKVPSTGSGAAPRTLKYFIAAEAASNAGFISSSTTAFAHGGTSVSPAVSIGIFKKQ